MTTGASPLDRSTGTDGEVGRVVAELHDTARRLSPLLTVQQYVDDPDLILNMDSEMLGPNPAQAVPNAVEENSHSMNVDIHQAETDTEQPAFAPNAELDFDSIMDVERQNTSAMSTSEPIETIVENQDRAANSIQTNSDENSSSGSSTTPPSTAEIEDSNNRPHGDVFEIFFYL